MAVVNPGKTHSSWNGNDHAMQGDKPQWNSGNLHEKANGQYGDNQINMLF